VALPRALAVDLGRPAAGPAKIEGIAAIDRSTVAVANDHAFDPGLFDATGKHSGQGLKRQILTIALLESLS
jgi:hypothetical protein